VNGRVVCLALTTTSLLIVAGGVARAQTLAPATLNLPSHDQNGASDMVQVPTSKSVEPVVKKRPSVAEIKPSKPVREPAQAASRESLQTATQKPVQSLPKSTGRTFTMDPVRPMNQPTVASTAKPSSRFSFTTRDGKKESAPVISQYYPKRIVYPFGKVDRHIDNRLLQAASIAQERAHAHSRSRCWHYVKEALLASGVIDSRPKTELARDAAAELVNNYGFKKLSITDPFSAPVGSVLVYGTARSVGHVEIRTKEGFVSDFRSTIPSRRPLMGVYAKL
jgi:hypothetical protein